MKIILDGTRMETIEDQISALRSARPHLKKPGDICGIMVAGQRFYGVRRNKASITVCPQIPSSSGEGRG